MDTLHVCQNIQVPAERRVLQCDPRPRLQQADPVSPCRDTRHMEAGSRGDKVTASSLRLPARSRSEELEPPALAADYVKKKVPSSSLSM